MVINLAAVRLGVHEGNTLIYMAIITIGTAIPFVTWYLYLKSKSKSEIHTGEIITSVIMSSYTLIQVNIFFSSNIHIWRIQF